MKSPPPIKPRSVFLLSLGCPKNRVDSERMLGSLGAAGFSVAKEPEDADVLVVNTCGFIAPAKEESIEAILELAEIKARSEGKKLVVTGCLTQRYGAELASEIPEVDFFLGTDAFAKIRGVLDPLPASQVQALPRVNTTREESPYWEGAPRLRSTRGGSAYLKVSEGCDNTCSFCIIPSIRGPQRSRPIAELVAEAEALVEGGAVELNLIAQDLSAYGFDLSPRPQLAELLEALSRIEDLRWIRMLYAYPRPMPDRFLDVWAKNEKILPYLDIPLQHAASRLLRIMRRGSDMGFVREELTRMRMRVGGAKGGLTLRTTFLVGHPGETEADFDELFRFVEQMRFERMGVFVYSDEEGTRGFDLPGKVDPKLAEERKEVLMELQRSISKAHQQSLIGRRLKVLVEGPSEESELVIQGRYAGQAPEIDGVVYIEGGLVAPGEIVEVEVSAAYDYDLVGTLLNQEESPAPRSLPILP